MRNDRKLRSALLALPCAAGLLAFGCHREESKPAQQAELPPAAAQAPAPSQTTEPAAPGSEPSIVEQREPATSGRQAAELQRPPQVVAPPPDAPSPEERRLAAREKRLAARQAQLAAREKRLKAREASQEQRPAQEPTREEAAAEVPTPDVGRLEVQDNSAPAPAPEPPRPEPVTVPSGTTMNVEFTKSVASDTSNAGDTFRARVTADVVQDGVVVIPAGSEVAGEVTQAVPGKKIGGKAALGVRFTDLILPTGETVPIQASLLRESQSKAGRDAATIGGAAAGGAILGNILNRASRGRGSIIGAIIGAAAGTAIAARNPGEQVTLDSGSVVAIQLDRPLEVHRRRADR